MPSFKRFSRDALTGLQDRAAFAHQAKQLINKASARGLRYAAAYLALLDMGPYVSRHGMDAGEEILKTIAKGLRASLPEHQLGRYSSGTFMAIIPVDDVDQVVERVNKALPREDNSASHIKVKAGWCEIVGGLTLREAMERAIYAFEAIRSNDPSYVRCFDADLEIAFRRRAYVVEHLDDAIKRGEIRAFAQPIIRTITGRVCEVEILSRWQSEEYGFLRPDEFIPELESHQLIHRLDIEVIRQACKQWAEAATLGLSVPFGVNLSRLDFELTDIYTAVTSVMADYNVPIDQVHIEVTESALASNDEMLLADIERFRSGGFKLYLDDFGSGYSSLRVLEGSSFDVVKLDKSLLDEVEVNERARAIVADSISMIKRLALETLCEGVETEEQFLFLKAVGCQKVQGFYFCKPLPHDEILSYLREHAETYEFEGEESYYETVGSVNLIDGTRASVQGIEAATFLGTQPFALIEVRDDQRISFLSVNGAFMRFVFSHGGYSLEQLTERLGDSLSDLRNKALYAASKTLQTKEPQQFDFVSEGHICTLGVTHVCSMRGRNAFLVEVLSTTGYSRYNDFRLLEESLRFLYTLFKRIDLLDRNDGSWRNIYLNVPRYTAQREDGTPQDEIDAFCNTFIHPDDRERFLEFYDLSTVEERLKDAPTDHLADTFIALSDSERYESHIFAIIPVDMKGRRQYLSCMRDLDLSLESVAHQRLNANAHVDDEALLTGLLEVTDRNIFWKDTKRRFLGANQNFLNYYGFESLEDILGHTDEDMGWTEGNQHYRDDEWRVLQGDRIHKVRGTTTDAKGEERVIEANKMPLTRDGRIVGLVGYFKDVGPLDK